MIGTGDAQRRDYGKDKVLGSETPAPVTGGAASGGKSGSGPTGSARTYPKGGKGVGSASFLPTGKPTYVVDGA